MSDELVLYTYYRSSCSARIRHALIYKGLPVTYRYIDLIHGQQNIPQYVAVNPSHSVPTLIAENGTLKLTQSVAILEYLEEKYPEKPLLPKDLRSRSLVRNLVNLISNDVQPVTNLRILAHAEKVGGNRAEWAKHYLQFGLDAYEALVKDSAGKYSVGNDVTMADVVLAPAVEAALRWDVNFDVLPTIMGIYKRLNELSAFNKGDWRHQEDTPESLRPKE